MSTLFIQHHYVIYQSSCDADKYKKAGTTKGTSKTFKKLKKGTKYKYYVKAVDAAGKTISKSKDVYSLTGNTKGKYTNTKSLKVTPTKKTLAVGKTVTLKAKAKGVKKGKKILAKGLCSQYRYMVTTADGKTTSNVVTVSSKGKVTAKKTGTAKVYVLAPNGVQKAVTITVK